MKTIEVYQNKTTKTGLTRYKVDDEDYEWLKDLRWRKTGNYAQVSAANAPYMHRLVLLAKNQFIPLKEGMFTDHINRDPTDNQSKNLRLVSRQQNTWNITMRRDKKLSKYTGVHFYQGYRDKSKRWFATIMMPNGKNISLRWFNTEKEAAKAYDYMIKGMREQYGVLNLSD